MGPSRQGVNRPAFHIATPLQCDHRARAGRLTKAIVWFNANPRRRVSPLVAKAIVRDGSVPRMNQSSRRDAEEVGVGSLGIPGFTGATTFYDFTVNGQ